MQKPLIIALDFQTKFDTIHFLEQFENERPFVKVGMELFYREGPAIIEALKTRGHEIFLDLKLHDIPNTVQQGMRSLASLGVDIVNVHAAGGMKMMQAAKEGLYAGTPLGMKSPKCIAVTQLTSTSDETLRNELLIEETMESTVRHYANMALQSGLDGVVCSVWEAALITKVCGEAFMKVTPGIRLNGDSIDDQTRIATPQEALKQTSTAIVVGRSITKSSNPLESYLQIKDLWGNER
ncbi:orotidine-5'-phosphate decarboxylase [Bacillus solimangrovi]|uniref:Orotidine 5'-phosphate decarboxylase n=1 Tax=Bacillus solimangrovi TaxID=1305675 RepID=A0A1E5LAS4_9BACI|nr:orotidine-5'-phosphate decarboxylase [Bacillus solimangrovi]OEH91198.1 orotidine 5'-phosphate decarboxylase [Bacillus solimangrovi]